MSNVQPEHDAKRRPKRNRGCRTKLKTGCATCRIRRVKCDEGRPFCQKCVGTGRTCDGYDSSFRFCNTQPVDKARAGGGKSLIESKSIRGTLTEVPLLDIDDFTRYFSTKTLLGAKLDCDAEAEQVLQASFTDPHVRNAVLSLLALREDLENSPDGRASVAQKTSNYEYGVRQYCLALAGLASNLSSPGSSEAKSALICCQIFISIEQVRGNYTSLAQHIIRGLGIMHELRARPSLGALNQLLPAHNEQLPLLDVFIIKLFSAPCKFKDPPPAPDANGTTPSECPVSGLRTIAPDMRKELIGIAALTLEFLGKVSYVESVDSALRLLSEKAELLNALEAWLADLELVQKKIGSSGPELLSVSFMRLFHVILNIVLLRTLDYSRDNHAELLTEHEQLKDVANTVEEGVKAYRTFS